jgi:hypothetical protein
VLGDYPDWTKQLLMLLWFWNKLQEACESADRSALTISIVRGGSEVGVCVDVPVVDTDPNIHSRRVNVSDEIPELSRSGEAVAVFERLRLEKYIHAALGPSDSGIFLDLSSKGRVEIGKFPEPGKRLAEAFEAVRQRIEQDRSLTENQRAERLDTLTKVVTLLNSSREIGQSVMDYF